MFEPLRDDPEGESLDPRKRCLLCVSISEDAGQLDDFRQPPAVVLSLDFDLERNQPLRLRATSIRRGYRPDHEEGED